MKGTADVALSARGKRVLLIVFVGFLIFLYLPTVMLIIFSFNSSTVIAFPLSHLTGSWYSAALGNVEIRNSLIASAKVAIGVAAVATVLGILVSYALARRNFRFKAALSAVVLLPLVVPTVVLGVALLVLFRPNHAVIPIPLSLWAVLIGQVIIALPFCVLLLLPRIASIDRRLQEAAYDLGASGLTTFRRVILPLITPAIMSSVIVAFVVSIDEVVVASFLVGRQVTYPVYLYSGLRLGGQTSVLMPIAVLMTAASVVLVVVAETIRRVGERRVGLAQSTKPTDTDIPAGAEVGLAQ
jgi:spermidine/putrescine transport system permease protein